MNKKSKTDKAYHSSQSINITGVKCDTKPRGILNTLPLRENLYSINSVLKMVDERQRIQLMSVRVPTSTNTIIFLAHPPNVFVSEYRNKYQVLC